MPPGGLHIRWPDAPLEQEARLMDYKWYAALAYVRANKLNHNVIEGPNDRFGIIASGKAYNDTRQALDDLGLDDDTCRALGIRLHKVNVVWPLEATITRDFAQGPAGDPGRRGEAPGHRVPDQGRALQLARRRAPERAGQVRRARGRRRSGGEWSMPNPSENWLLRAKADLTPAIIAKAIAKRLKKLGVGSLTRHRGAHGRAHRADRRQGASLACSRRAAPTAGERMPVVLQRLPAQHQHPRARRLARGRRHRLPLHGGVDGPQHRHLQPDGRRGRAVGRPGALHRPTSTSSPTWATAPTSTRGCWRSARASPPGVNITYKILFNDAVAMTGGQPVDGTTATVPEMTRELDAEGAAKIVIVTDEPDKYDGQSRAPRAGVTVHHRDELDAIQRELREVQAARCSSTTRPAPTEKRRRRKRGTMVDPDKRVVINELVCEGCGDCSVQSNCLSVEPVETEFGRKRRINQNSCNKDYSCVKGFCPSFVTVEGGQLKSAEEGSRAAADPLRCRRCPSRRCRWPRRPGASSSPASAAPASSRSASCSAWPRTSKARASSRRTPAGLAQKGGATWSHIQIADRPDAIYTTKVGTAEADLVIGCDPIVAAEQGDAGGDARRPHLRRAEHPRHADRRVRHRTPTGSFRPATARRRSRASGRRRGTSAPSTPTSLAVQLLGDSLYTNPLLLGYAWQQGRVPLSRAALLRAIELNGVQVDNNKPAFEWGRRCAHDLAAVQALLKPAAGDRVRPQDRRRRRHASPSGSSS